MRKIPFILRLLLILAATGLASKHTFVSAAPSSYFKVRVVDGQTGRGVPLVELKAVNSAAWWTDSNGIAALDEPGLMGQEVFLHVFSPGYEYPKDGFGFRGLKLRPSPGGVAQITLTRTNIAERLYRVTGQGIYSDSVLTSEPVPLKHPVINGLVMGQDTVIATPYRGKLFWFWGDTERVAYPLGNFAVSGAVSEWPGRGGLDPSVGVNLEYFADRSGFSKPMCPDFGEGLHWIECVMTVPDTNGIDKLVARVSSQKGLAPAYAWRLAVFNDAKQIFEPRVRWDWTEGHDSAHPFRAKANGVEYLYLYPNFRVKADLQSLSDLSRYEAFTCVPGDGKVSGAETGVDRDASGRARYTWKPGADRLHSGRLKKLIAAGKLQAGESWLHLHNVETGASFEAGRGSVFWNEYRKRWVMIMSGLPGEIWFSEADTPVGPWVYARRVATHGRYNFYNQTQHPFFDQDGGRLIYFEGTYTDSFSGAPAKTPRYDYNQLMYRLALDDPRLSLPAPVYRVKDGGGSMQYLLREGVQAMQAWDDIQEAAFFAVPPARKHEGLVPIYASGGNAEFRLQTSRAIAAAEPLFYALPVLADAASGTGTEDNSPVIVPLFEYRNPSDGRRSYTANASVSTPGVRRAEKPICRVWRNPLAMLALDFEVQPLSDRPK